MSALRDLYADLDATIPSLGEDTHTSREAPRHDGPSWPILDEAARYGLAGDVVRTIEPHSEADPVAVLAQFLVAFGSVIGRSAHFTAEADRHYCNLFTVLVGKTAGGRKGTSWGQVRRVFTSVDNEWTDKCVQTGLSSGEGLIWAVRDAVETKEPLKEKGRVVDYQTVETDAGVADKRLLAIEPEFASALRSASRDGSTLSAVIRNAWDTGDLSTLTKNATNRATGAHVSQIGHITKDELLRYLDSTETANGFANRYIWICVNRSKTLPEGGQLHTVDMAPLVRRLSEAVAFARPVGEMRRDDEARAIWHRVYPALSEGKPGLLGSVVARAEAQVMRLACIYALLDLSVTIRRDHLLAALALWEYAEASARYIFGDALGDPVADELLQALRARSDGMTRTEIRDLFGRHRSAHAIGRALGTLDAANLARRAQEETNGRPAERWFAQ